MINIIIQGKHLILNPDTVIKLQLIFPDPTKDNLPNSLVQWFNIPAIIENDEIFNFAKYIIINDKIRIYENAVLEASGISKTGKLIVKTATNDSYKVSITFNPFSEGFKDKLLQSINLPGYNIGSDEDTIVTNAKSKSQLSYPNTDFVFPMIKMGNFYGSDINENFLFFINYYLNDAYQKNIELSDGSGNINCLVPHFFLLSVLEAVFNDVNYNLIGQFIQDPGIQKLIIFNNYALDKLRTDYIVKAWTTSTKDILYPPSAPGFIPISIDEEIDEDGIFNGYEYIFSTPGWYKLSVSVDATVDGDNNDHYYGYFWLSAFFTAIGIDDITLSIFFRSIIYSGSGIGYGAYGSVSNDTIFYIDSSQIGTKIQFKNSGVGMTFHRDGDNNIIEDGFEDINHHYKNLNIFINPYSYNNKNVFEGDIDMKNHIPDISVSDFVNNLVKLYSLAVFTNKKNEIEFTFWKDILSNNKLLDLTEYYIKDSDEVEVYKDVYSLKMPFSDDEIDKREIDIYPVLGSVFKKDIPFTSISNEVYYLKDLNRWIMSFFDFEVNGLEWKPYRDNFKNINNDVSSAKEIQINVKTLQMHFNGYPVSNLQGTSPEFGLGKTDFPFQLLYYFGIIPNGSYATFPYASNNQYKPDGTSGADNALRLNDADGIYEKYSKSYYDYVAERDVNTVMLNINDKILADIVSLFEAGSDTRKIRIVNRNYLPVQIDVEIGMNGIKSCKAKLR